MSHRTKSLVAALLAISCAACASPEEQQRAARVDRLEATARYLEAEWEAEGDGPPWCGDPVAGDSVRLTFLPAYLEPEKTWASGYVVSEVRGSRRQTYLLPYELAASVDGPPSIVVAHYAFRCQVDPQLGRLVLRDGDRKVKLRAMKGVLELSQASTSVERSIPANDPEVVRRARGEAPSTP